MKVNTKNRENVNPRTQLFLIETIDLFFFAQKQDFGQKLSVILLT